jgi:hypothetical protein
MATAAKKAVGRAQEVCIDLPGEAVQCWRSSDHVKVILRKHRDVLFDINLKAGAVYTVESTGDFYSPRDKKLLRTVRFSDGERFQIWVGRQFEHILTLKVDGATIGKYKVATLDETSYGADPKIKPEPLMVVIGERREGAPHMCTPADPFGIGPAHQSLKISFEPKLSALNNLGTAFDYRYPPDAPEVTDYVAVTEARPEEIQPQVLKQLDSGVAVVGKPGEIFLRPQINQSESCLQVALKSAAAYISGSNFFKETAGYLQEHFRSLDKISMMVRVEKKAKGTYRVALKGRPVTLWVSQALGTAGTTKPKHANFALGSKESEFLDGGFSKSGKAGYGGFRRIILTSAEKFKGGMKIQAIGTVIDLIVDVHTVYFDEKGSKDLSEFLGRAGVSIAKAGATAAIGSMFAAAGIALVTAGAAAVGVAALPVAVVVAVAIGGYILAATIVDRIDDRLNLKGQVADLAR